MGVTDWTSFLRDDLRLDVHIEYDRGEPRRYSFQLLGYVGGEWVTLVRYDTAHGEPHRHICYPNGAVEMMPFVAVLPITFVGWVQRDIQEHAEHYLEEYGRQAMNLLMGRSE